MFLKLVVNITCNAGKPDIFSLKSEQGQGSQCQPFILALFDTFQTMLGDGKNKYHLYNHKGEKNYSLIIHNH
jgi:hypothetical protein